MLTLIRHLFTRAISANSVYSGTCCRRTWQLVFRVPLVDFRLEGVGSRVGFPLCPIREVKSFIDKRRNRGARSARPPGPVSAKHAGEAPAFLPLFAGLLTLALFVAAAIRGVFF
jgi:hypothetical protein